MKWYYVLLLSMNFLLFFFRKWTPSFHIICHSHKDGRLYDLISIKRGKKRRNHILFISCSCHLTLSHTLVLLIVDNNVLFPLFAFAFYLKNSGLYALLCSNRKENCLIRFLFFLHITLYILFSSNQLSKAPCPSSADAGVTIRLINNNRGPRSKTFL